MLSLSDDLHKQRCCHRAFVHYKFTKGKAGSGNHTCFVMAMMSWSLLKVQDILLK